MSIIIYYHAYSIIQTAPLAVPPHHFPQKVHGKEQPRISPMVKPYRTTPRPLPAAAMMELMHLKSAP